MAIWSFGCAWGRVCVEKPKAREVGRVEKGQAADRLGKGAKRKTKEHRRREEKLEVSREKANDHRADPTEKVTEVLLSLGLLRDKWIQSLRIASRSAGCSIR